LRKIFYCQLRKVSVMELLTTTTNLLKDQRVSQMHGFAKNTVLIVSASKT